MIVGFLINLSGWNPVQALFWSAVINGIVAVPIMVTVMLLSADERVMGAFRVSGGLRLLGWAATAVMALASAVFFYSTLVGAH